MSISVLIRVMRELAFLLCNPPCEDTSQQSATWKKALPELGYVDMISDFESLEL